MLLWLLSYMGGVLTILSPCILPVLPFVFSKSDQPFYKSGLPLLAGMAATFAAASLLAVAGGSWAVQVSQWGRWIALAFLSFFALSLLSPRLSEWMTRPFLRLGGSLQATSQTERSWGRSFVLGMATGLLWAPCAGPILGLILTGAAIKGASANTAILLLAYALGAATSLAAALLAGGKLLGTLKRYLGADEWVRRILGVAVLVGVLAIALGWDRGLLTRLSRIQTETLEQRLVAKLQHSDTATPASNPDQMPELAGAGPWINSPPLTRESLKGKVVLIDFWTYSCINCLRTLPHVKAWWEKYKDSGLVIIGMHTPEFAFEKDEENVRKAVRDLGIAYPVAMDNDYAVWSAFSNRYWPAHYFIDAMGRIRHHHFGEGGYEESEQVIRQLLAEAHGDALPKTAAPMTAEGALAASSGEAASPETYLGYARFENLVITPPVKDDREVVYTPAAAYARNQWSLAGSWTVHAENATLGKAPGRILYRFHARDLHLVLAPGTGGKPVRFQVRLDGVAPGEDHGTDIDAAGQGRVTEQRLYQLIRQKNSKAIQDRIFEIEFLDPGVQAYAFTFG